jgi:hypothetical protein
VGVIIIPEEGQDIKVISHLGLSGFIIFYEYKQMGPWMTLFALPRVDGFDGDIA